MQRQTEMKYRHREQEADTRVLILVTQALVLAAPPLMPWSVPYPRMKALNSTCINLTLWCEDGLGYAAVTTLRS